jgi:translation initiation factor IF-1
MYRVGDLVQYPKSNEVTGFITKVKGKKWFRVRWNDGVILDEHLDDLRPVIEDKHEVDK